MYFIFMQSRDEVQYQMRLEPSNTSKPFEKFALVYIPPNTTDKYYVLPQSKGHTAPLTLHKNPHRKDKFMFRAQSSGETIMP